MTLAQLAALIDAENDLVGPGPERSPSTERATIADLVGLAGLAGGGS